MNEPTTAPEVLARISGHCPLCPHRIRADQDYIAKVPQLGWAHAICAAGYVRARAENLEDSADG